MCNIVTYEELCVQLLGSLPAIFITETIMEHIGEALDIPSEIVKQKNLYEKGQVFNQLYF